MTTNVYSKPLVKEFTEELGTLLSIRISQYLRKYKNDSEAKFINEFIICPYFEDFDKDLILYPASARSHFEENLNINFSHFELNHLSLNIDMKVEYSLQCYPYFIDDEIDSDALDFGLVGNQVTFYHQDMIDFLETFDDDIWNKLTRELRKEISFGTLKNS